MPGEETSVTSADSAAARAAMAKVLDRLRVVKNLPGGVQSHGGGRVALDVSPELIELLAEHALGAERTLDVDGGINTIVFAAAKTQHTAIGRSAEDYSRLAAYSTRLGVDAANVDFREGAADEVLPGLQGTYDVALIAGTPAFPQSIVAYHYVSRLLSPGSVLVVDSLPSPAIGALHKHLIADPRWELLAIVGDRAAAYRLVSPLSAAPEGTGQEQDFSFLPLGRRLRVQARSQASHSTVLSAARRRVPLVDRLASAVRNRLG